MYRSNDELCAMIRAYWSDRGYAVRVRTELKETELPGGGTGRHVEITSDTLNGLPTGLRQAWAAQ